MISSIANTGYARWRLSPSSVRDPKSQAEGPNIIYEVSKLPPRLVRERSFRLGSTPSKSLARSGQANGKDKLQVETGLAEMMSQSTVIIAGRLNPDPYR